MQTSWLSEAELLEQVGLSTDELRWYEEQFAQQMRYLKRAEGVSTWYNPDAVAMLRGLSTMVSQGATPEQIKGWFGLAAAQEENPAVPS